MAWRPTAGTVRGGTQHGEEEKGPDMEVVNGEPWSGKETNVQM